MSTGVGGIEADRKTLRLRAARQRREARIRFWRAFAVSSFFVVALGANLGDPAASLLRAMDDIAAIATISAVGPAARNILFPPEAYAAIPAIATLYKNCYFIYKHDFLDCLAFFIESFFFM